MNKLLLGLSIFLLLEYNACAAKTVMTPTY